MFRYKHCYLFSISGLQPVVIILALIGKALSAGAFGIVYIFTAELLPTVVRNASMGTCSCSARIGGMIAPYIAKTVSHAFECFTMNTSTKLTNHVLWNEASNVNLRI